MATRTSRERFTELLFYGIVLLVAYLAMQVVWPFLSPLTWAAILGMSLRPVYRRLVIRSTNGRAALVTTLMAGALVIAPAVFFAFVIAQQVPVALAYLNTLSSTSPEQIVQLWQSITARVPLPLPSDPIAFLSQGASAGVTFLATNAGGVLANVLSTLGSTLVMLFALFFFLRDGRVFAEYVRRILPFSDQESSRLISETSELVVASVGAGLMIAAIQGLIGGVSFWGLGLPAPAVWGASFAVASLLPVVGTSIVWVPVASWLLLSGDVWRAVMMTVLCGLLLGSVDNVLRPWLLAGRTSASGLVLFIGLLGGVSAFGFVGLVIGPIVLVLAGTLLDALTRRLYDPIDDVTLAE